MKCPRLILLTLFLCFQTALWSQHEAAIDSSFGENGFLEMQGSSFSLTPSGQIIVTDIQNYKVLFYKYDQNGLIVNSWGRNGVKEFELDSLLSVSRVKSYSGAGYQIEGKTKAGFPFTARLLEEVMIDSSFGDNGILIIEDHFGIHATSEMGSTVVASSIDMNGRSAVTKFKVNGQLDSTFGINGSVILTDQKGSYSHINFLNHEEFAVRGWEPFSTIMNASADNLMLFDNDGLVKDYVFFPIGLAGISNFDMDVAYLGYHLYPGDEYTAYLRKVTKTGIIESFPDNSECDSLTFDVEHPYVYMHSPKIINSQIYTVGTYSYGSPSKIFIKRLNLDGYLDRSFGADGNIFFKRPGLDNGYYYPRSMLLNGQDQIYLQIGIDELDGTGIHEFIIKLDGRILSSNHDLKYEATPSIHPNPGNSTFTVTCDGYLVDIKAFGVDGLEIPLHRTGNSFRLLERHNGIIYIKIVSDQMIHSSSIVISNQ